MPSLLDSSSGLWTVLGQTSNVVQLVGVDALGLVSMVVQAALAARRHRDACWRLAQHVEIVGGLLRELELAELMRREATRRPLEQLRGALRRCYALVTACQDCGYLRSLLVGARMAEELRTAEQEIDMFIRLIPLIALVDTTHDRCVTAAEGVAGVITNGSSHHIRFPRSTSDFTKIQIQGATEVCNVAKQPLAGAMDLQEQKILDIEGLLELCTRTEESFPAFTKFDFVQIVNATDNFSENRNVGWGGFATVYKGQLPDGLMIAVKRFDEHATLFYFKSEFLLARLQHTRLLGWCIHGKERILVYEFMDKGSLHRLIFDKIKGPLLDWSKRLNIIKGLADGLVYLHKHSMLRIVHRDLKPMNILLDHDMNPKIADFGSARTLSSDVAEECTSRVVGTSGYKAPEYACRGLYSVKTDVFSFGVLALVIISGRKNTILEQQGDTVGNLIRDAWQLWNDGRLHDLVDPLLSDGYEIAGIMRCAQVSLLCAQEDPEDRPTMSDVVAFLNFESISLLPIPKQPSELINGGAIDNKLSTDIGQSSRTIDITITSSALVSTRVRIIVDPET
ncbi:cysteine-rich receptor-like protein kinase 10 isoform X2 [Phragmites australis]|uniref:cysteine-rich receptor-like protein kinase 10 isoform X2 n=1 Tax=Phragmites australis TaxID=29695 RepID=UPI002D76578C|nr:cysteine-rich receptor-like protein kinase 10 isoform X2 [Phragmites australis]